MKIAFAEAPSTKDRDMSIELSYIPPEAEVVIAVYDEHAQNNEQFYKDIADADIVINGYIYLDRRAIDAMPNCKVISFQSTGYNEVDFAYATQKGIAIASIEDYCTQETAENAIATMLSLQRGLKIYDRSVQQDRAWIYDAAKGLKRVEGQVMGIVGLGRIGQAVAKKAKGLDMEVIAYDPFLPPEIAEGIGVELVDMDTILERSDVISIHMNLTEDNYHFFDREKFAKCRKKPIIVNEGRGAMICEEDLAWALDEGLIRGAALDMLESEFPDLTDCKLLGRDNVIITPHSGFYSDTSIELLSSLSIKNALLCYYGKHKEARAVRNGIGLD